MSNPFNIQYRDGASFNKINTTFDNDQEGSMRLLIALLEDFQYSNNVSKTGEGD